MEVLDLQAEIEESNIGTIINGLRNFAKGDIEKSLEKNMLIATFILCACFIDQVSGYYCGINHMKGVKPIVGKRFKQFCKDYLHDKINKNHDDELLYNELRNEIVHSYSSTGKFALGTGLKDSHLKKHKNGSIILSADVFFADISCAFEMWVNDLKKNQDLRRDTLMWFNLHKTFELIELEPKDDKIGNSQRVFLE